MQQQQQPPQGSGGYAGVSPENMVSFGGSSSTPRAQMLAAAGGGGSEQVEAASPISSRPPASSINFDELVDDPDRAGGGGGVSSGNRWPRQETLALLKIRSEMDVAFRDATLKGPLWDEVSRKLGELGYVRSAKKCKEKFENVHKYYKRTKEGRAGRQDGKSYRFFTQLEALQGAPTASGSGVGGGGNLIPSAASPVMTSGPNNPATSTAAAASVGNIQFATPVSVGTVGGGGGDVMQRGLAQPFTMYSSMSMGQQAMPASRAPPGLAATVAPHGGIGISFSSDSASSESFDSEEDEDEEVEDMSEEELDRPSANPVGSGQKRKRGYSKGGNKRRMMDFFEGLMKQVMQKQEAMQHRFLEIIEKREQDRLMREEAWKRQEAARLNREQELAAQERVMAASRDAAIVSFLQKITGQTIQLPQPVYTTTVHHPPPPPPAPTIPPSSAPLHTATPPPSRQQFVQKPQQQVQQQHHMPPPQPTEAIMAVPERQIPPQDPDPPTGGSSSLEPALSSRWPKAEVLALIKLRSNLENRYQESGPKGPLWEEISAGMQRMGYNRSSKRCKEKWENINKYFKKVKESNKKRPEDAKTCPYFNELDALYQRKKLGSSSSSGMALFQQQQIQPQQTAAAGLALDQSAAATNLQELASATVQASSAHVEPMNIGAAVPDPVHPNKGGLQDSIFCDQGSTDAGGSRKPEDIMMEQQAAHNQLNLDDYDQKMDELGDSTDNNLEDDQGDNDEDESESDRKMGYKIEFQAGAQSNNKNGGSNNNEAPTFITMVQ
ncbi:unnamed protein product [Rhodiola kirilowii]